MFGGFFNRMYYGDPRKADLKKEDLKGNRFKLFTTVLSVRFWQLIQLNLLNSILDSGSSSAACSGYYACSGECTGGFGCI